MDISSLLGMVKASFNPSLPDPHADEDARRMLADVFEEYGDRNYASALRSPVKRPKDYCVKAISDAAETAREYLDTIIQQLIDSRMASDDLHNDYPNGDGYHHETHVDRPAHYSLQEATEILNQCSDTVETDYGLWEGSEPEEAISIQAMFTYGAQVIARWLDLIALINEDLEVEILLDNEAGLEEAVLRERLAQEIESIIRDFAGEKKEESRS